MRRRILWLFFLHMPFLCSSYASFAFDLFPVLAGIVSLQFFWIVNNPMLSARSSSGNYLLGGGML